MDDIRGPFAMTQRNAACYTTRIVCRRTSTAGADGRRTFTRRRSGRSITHAKIGGARSASTSATSSTAPAKASRPTSLGHSPVQYRNIRVALVGHSRTGRYYFPLGVVGDREAAVNLSQVRLFDSKRLIRKIGMLDERAFRQLAKALALTLFPFLDLK
jgi:hypothetical protein